MKMATLRATAKHPTRAVGEIYQVGGGDLLIDLAAKRGVPCKEVVTFEDRPKRTYRRRNMTAE